mmetsp:Transcript_27574/g.49916  ORF Transcript_27574/g.49916 Transcript_27574/m.49916 type:complete len:348 (+) Transcript_27574:100-1143(+)
MARWRLKLEDFGRRQEGPNETAEAWHAPRWASKPPKLEKDATRPNSSASTRAPSSARGRSPFSAWGEGETRPSSPTSPISSPIPMVHRASPTPSDHSFGQEAPKSARATTVGQHAEEDTPAEYSLKHGDTRGGVLVPHYDLWVTLRGGNGRWRQALAREEWILQVMAHEEAESQRKQEADRQRLRRAEVARIRRAEEEELRRRVEEAEQEKRRRKEEELRQQMLREEEARRRRAEEERLLALQKPRPCQKCGGNGRCTNCEGEGKTDILFLAPSVGPRHSPIPQGRRHRGCKQCGGGGDGALLGDFWAGTGKCTTCHGAGVIKPPPGGFREKPGREALSSLGTKEFR